MPIAFYSAEYRVASVAGFSVVQLADPRDLRLGVHRCVGLSRLFPTERFYECFYLVSFRNVCGTDGGSSEASIESRSFSMARISR